MTDYDLNSFPINNGVKTNYFIQINNHLEVNNGILNPNIC